MRLSFLFTLCLAIGTLGCVGCSEDTGTVADEDTLSEYLDENPEVMIDEEAEEELMEADRAVEE